ADVVGAVVPVARARGSSLRQPAVCRATIGAALPGGIAAFQGVDHAVSALRGRECAVKNTGTGGGGAVHLLADSPAGAAEVSPESSDVRRGMQAEVSLESSDLPRGRERARYRIDGAGEGKLVGKQRDGTADVGRRTDGTGTAHLEGGSCLHLGQPARAGVGGNIGAPR